jgi:hypothetical protein
MVFALADPYVSRALPYADPDRLVSIEFGLGDPNAAVQTGPADVPSLADWQARADLFDGLAAFDDAGWLRARLPYRVVPLRAVAVTDNLLEVLILERRLGAGSNVAWVSNRAATTLSGGELSPGRSVPLIPSGGLRVEGILPRSFLLPQADRTDAVDALVILPPGPVIRITRSPARSARPLKLVGRTREGVTPEIIEAALGPSISAVGGSMSVVPLRTRLTARQQALASGAVFACVLVIVVCWLNVFNIALTRCLYREPELATRTALGATPSQLMRLLVADGLRVAALGSAGALAVTWGSLRLAVGVLPAEFATLGVPSVTPRVTVFILLAGAVACLSWCFASIAAWRLNARHHASRIVGRDGRAIRAMRFGVISGQVWVASVLLAAAALLGRSYINLLGVDAGMDDATQTMTVAHDPSLPPAVRSEFVDRVTAALRRREGVQAVGVESNDMLNGRRDFQGVMVDGQFASLEWTRVDRGFLTAAGLRFLLGGLPELGRPGAVVTESMALKYFAGRSPIGAVLNVGRAVPIVGVVHDVRTIGLSVAPKPIVYEVGGEWSSATVTYLVRVADGSRGPVDWQPVLRSIDPMAVVLREGTVGERLASSVRDRTFATLVVGLFSTASVLVTVLGLAGVVAYAVAKRTREVAIRLTLGATRLRVSWLVVGDAMTAAIAGAVGGIIGAGWLSGALESLLYGIRPSDPSTLFVTAVGLIAIVVGTAVMPAMRTNRIAPASALRSE